MAKQNRN